MVQDLFFEIIHQSQHIFLDAKDSTLVNELKQIIQGILKIPAEKQILVKFHDDNLNDYEKYTPMEDRRTLQECGFTTSNAKAQAPCPIGLYFEGEDGPVINKLSSPPPIPDTMRNDNQQE